MDDDRNIKCEDCSNRDASTVKCKSVYEKQNPVTVKKNPPLAQLDRWRSIYKDSANTDEVCEKNFKNRPRQSIFQRDG